MDRNKQQSDIMFNIVLEFGIHGAINGQRLYTDIIKIVETYGDAVRIVGVNTKKPTARPNLRVLLPMIYTQNTVAVEDTDDAEHTNPSQEKEEVANDKESDSSNSD